jgi:ATP-binding cassette subfamily B protein
MAENTDARRQATGGAKASGAVAGRVIRTIFGFYPVLAPVVLVCIIVSAVSNALPAIFMQNILQVVQDTWEGGDWGAAAPQVTGLVTGLVCIYVVAIVASFSWTRLMATVTQGTLMKLRKLMFNRMEDLPIRYFDTHPHGDVMSYYTNDVDALRQMVSQSLPNLLMTVLTMATIFLIMLYYSVWMTLVVICGVMRS